MARPRVTESDAVLDAAARRLASHGIAGTTVDDVAAEAGVSRATVYRYIGGKNQLVPAVIGREAEEILDRLAAAVGSSASVDGVITQLVSTSLVMIADSPVLARLTSTDLRESLPFITVASPPLMERVVSTLSSAIRDAPGLSVEDRAVEDAVEEAARFVFANLTTPRRDGSRLVASEAGRRAAELIAPMLSPGGAPRRG